MAPGRLPVTTPDLLRDDATPYFVWWAPVTIAEFRLLVAAPDRQTRAYWMGALLREANTRDVWIFITPEDVRQLWPDIVRHLGRRRAMWAFLFGLPEPQWPARGGRDG